MPPRSEDSRRSHHEAAQSGHGAGAPDRWREKVHGLAVPDGIERLTTEDARTPVGGIRPLHPRFGHKHAALFGGCEGIVTRSFAQLPRRSLLDRRRPRRARCASSRQSTTSRRSAMPRRASILKQLDGGVRRLVRGVALDGERLVVVRRDEPDERNRAPMLRRASRRRTSASSSFDLEVRGTGGIDTIERRASGIEVARRQLDRKQRAECLDMPSRGSRAMSSSTIFSLVRERQLARRATTLRVELGVGRMARWRGGARRAQVAIRSIPDECAPWPPGQSARGDAPRERAARFPDHAVNGRRPRCRTMPRLVDASRAAKSGSTSATACCA